MASPVEWSISFSQNESPLSCFYMSSRRGTIDSKGQVWSLLQTTKFGCHGHSTPLRCILMGYTFIKNQPSYLAYVPYSLGNVGFYSNVDQVISRSLFFIIPYVKPCLSVPTINIIRVIAL